MDSLSASLLHLLGYLRIGCEIGILAFLIYSALLFVRGTRAATILAGIVIVIITLSLLSRVFGMEVIEHIMLKLWTLLAMAVLIIFQPEFRRAFAQLGSQQNRLLHSAAIKRQREIIDILTDAAVYLAERRIGALIAVERNVGMRAFAETGTYVNAPLTRELLTTIFTPNSPLHDGGIIISQGLLLAAGCIFPLTQSEELSHNLGTRHRAGVGVTEENDAVAIIVSEETGAISLACGGRLVRGISRRRLERHLTNYLTKPRGTPVPALGTAETTGRPGDGLLDESESVDQDAMTT
jgi:diadenylate cyclase